MRRLQIHFLKIQLTSKAFRKVSPTSVPFVAHLTALGTIPKAIQDPQITSGFEPNVAFDAGAAAGPSEHFGSSQ